MDDLVQVTEKVQVITKCMHCFGDERSHPHGYAEASLRLSSPPVPQVCLSKMLCLGRCNVLTQFLDGSHLFQAMRLREVTQMRAIVVSGQFVQAQQ